MIQKSLLLLLGIAATVWGQADKTVLCHVPVGNPENARTIDTANPSAHLNPDTGEPNSGHELDFLGPCEEPNDPPDPPDPPARLRESRRRLVPDPMIVSCVVFPAFRNDPRLLANNLNDHDGHLVIRSASPEGEEVFEVAVAAQGRAELGLPNPSFNGYVEVKAHTADIRSVVEFDLPGKGLTREYGLPCWDDTDTPLYGTWGVLERTDHSLRWRRGQDR